MSHHWLRTLRRVIRLQRRAPAVALLIVVTLALGIGADVTVFSVVDPLILRPLPFQDPQQLGIVTASFPRGRISGMGLSGPEVLELADLTHGFSSIGASTFSTVTVRTADGTLRASAAEASAALIEALRVAPSAGRLYGRDEDREGAPPVAVLSDAFWQRAFGGDPQIVGRVLDIDGVQTSVLGIMPPRADLLNRQIDVWVPLGLTLATAGSRGDHRYTVLVRRKPGVTEGMAAADLAAAVAGWQRATGEFHSPAPGFHPLELHPLAEATSGAAARPLGALSAAVALVLLLACANVANLTLARAEGRRADLAIEVALGAESRHLAQLYIVEALLFSITGSAAGLLLATIALQGLKTFGPALVRPDEIVINGRVLLFTAGAAIVTSALTAVAPILRLDVRRAFVWMQAGGRGALGAADGLRLQHTLVAIQIAVAVALSVAGLVTVRSLLALTRIDPGFRTDAVLRAQVSLPEGPYKADERVWSLYERLVARVGALPGVRGVAVMSGLPPLRPANNTTFVLDGAAAAMFDHSAMPQVDFVQHVSPDYFVVMGIPIRAGRTFTDADREASLPVAIVNETLARRFWPGQSALGKRLRPAIRGVPYFTVVAVVGDVRQAGLQAAAGSELYVPYRQGRVLFPAYLPRAMNLVIAGESDPLALAAPAAGVAHALEPGAAVSGVGLMSLAVARLIAQPRMLTWLLMAFAALALVLAAVGVYGVTAGSVSARRGEFGVRVALGATPRDVLGLVFRSAGASLGAGIALGSAGGFAALRYLATLLYAVSASNVVPVAAAAILLTLVAIGALTIPALRAARLDPLRALRSS